MNPKQFFAAGILTHDTRDFWAYGVGISRTSAVLNAISDYKRAFLAPCGTAYGMIWVCEIDPHYARALEIATTKTAIYVPPVRMLSNPKQLDIERLIQNE